MRRILTHGLLGLALCATVATAGLAQAQEIPSWAEPTKPTPPPPPSFGPDLPDDPDPIPVGGGLGWLVLAGAGYAVHRLRRDDG